MEKLRLTIGGFSLIIKALEGLNMGTKERLLSLLEGHKGEYFSGEEIARLLSVSRTAVWKAVNTLRADGYEIDAVQNRGYCLDAHTDILSVSGIRQQLDSRWESLELELIPCAASTNALLRERAANGAPEGTVILANQQTQGRGRLGREFYSPPDTGIYLSLLLRPQALEPTQAVKITTMAAVAACRAIEAVSGKQAQIKWVNDIFLNGKKVSGILTEASISLESGRLDYAVLGIGFNVYPPAGGFPPALAEIADSILRNQQNQGKNLLAASFLNHFLDIYHGDDPAEYAAAYRERSMVIGQPIQVISPTGVRNAYALDVDKDCRLIVRYEDGTIDRLSSAEISIRA